MLGAGSAWRRAWRRCATRYRYRSRSRPGWVLTGTTVTPLLGEFVQGVADAGCETLIVHARKAWLQGVSPRQNRELPPLRYAWVYRLKRDFPHLRIVVNGGVRTLDAAHAHLAHVDGVMIGREAYHNPYLLAAADRRCFGGLAPVRTRAEILADYLAYIDAQLQAGVHLKHTARHLLGLFHGAPGARAWRRAISSEAHRPGSGSDMIRAAAQHVLHPAGLVESAAREVAAEPSFA